MKILYSNAFSSRLAVAILKLPSGVDFSDIQIEIADVASMPSSAAVSTSSSFTDLKAISKNPRLRLMHVDSNLHMDVMDSNPAPLPVPVIKPSKIWHRSTGIILSFQLHSRCTSGPYKGPS